MPCAYILALDAGTPAFARSFRSQRRSPPLHSGDPPDYPQPGWVSMIGRNLSSQVAVAMEAWECERESRRHHRDRHHQSTGDEHCVGPRNGERSTTRSCGRIAALRECAISCAARGLKMIQKRTGLLLDSYFSATKVAWILTMLRGAQESEQGKLAFGTVDSWRCGDSPAVRDISPTQQCLAHAVLNIHTGEWTRNC